MFVPLAKILYCSPRNVILENMQDSWKTNPILHFQEVKLCNIRQKFVGCWHSVDANPCYLNSCLITILVPSLCRFREVIATNNIRPWELASVFKQVLRDFLSQKEYDEDDGLPVQPAQLQPMEAWTSHYKMRQAFVTPTVPNCGDHPREEIPTISGYVDRVMRYSSSFAGSSRDWDLPYYYPVPVRPIEAYSTTLWED